MSVAVSQNFSPRTISVTPHRQVNLRKYASVLVWDGESYRTINAPVRAYFKNDGTLSSVQGPYGCGGKYTVHAIGSGAYIKVMIPWGEDTNSVVLPTFNF